MSNFVSNFDWKMFLCLVGFALAFLLILGVFGAVIRAIDNAPDWVKALVLFVVILVACAVAACTL